MKKPPIPFSYFVGGTPLAYRNPEDPGKPSLVEMIQCLAESLT